MVKPVSPPRDVSDDDESSSRSQSSWSESGISDAYDSQDEESFGSSSSGSCSLDSVGKMLIRLEDNDASLDEITIDCESLDREAASFFSQIVPNNTHLKKLCVHCSRRSRHRQILRKVLVGLKENSSIGHIEIHGAEIDCDGASWLVPAVAHKQNLQNISMVNCDFVGSGLGILFVAMQHNKCIRHLRFQSCAWEDHNADIIASSLQFLHLHSLSLVDINIAETSWPYLYQNIEHCKDIIFLDLSQNDVDLSNMQLLIKCIRVHKSISKLSLLSCGLHDKYMKELARNLRHHNTLTSLDISQNVGISDKGVVYLKDLLKFNKSITELRVDGCGLSVQSVNAVESGLRYNNSILKSFLSETASQAFFGVVDGVVDSMEQLSFDSEASPRKEELHSSPKNNRKVRDKQSSLRKSNPMPVNQNSAHHTKGKNTRTKKPVGVQRRMLL